MNLGDNQRRDHKVRWQLKVSALLVMTAKIRHADFNFIYYNRESRQILLLYMNNNQSVGCT